MSYAPHDHFGLDPSTDHGGEPVGCLEHLDPQGRTVVSLMRGGDAIRNESDITKIYGQIVVVFARHARRPLMRHHVDCTCLGADEAVMARLVRLASQGAREDATLMAMLLIRADIAPLAVSLAEQLGLVITAGLGRETRAMAGLHQSTGAYH